MVNLLTLVLFLITGATLGWFGFDYLPVQIVLKLDHVGEARVLSGGISCFIGLIIGFRF